MQIQKRLNQQSIIFQKIYSNIEFNFFKYIKITKKTLEQIFNYFFQFKKQKMKSS